MEPLLIFCIVGIIVSLAMLIYGVQGYIRGRKMFNSYMEAMAKYLREEANK